MLDRWNGSVKNLISIISSLDDGALENEVAPGKKRGTYL